MKLIFEYDENDSKHVSDIQDNDDYYDNNNGKKLVKPDIQVELPNDLLRKELPLPNVSEPTVVRHYTNMSQMNYGIDLGFYPLGSCTMKYNPKVNEDIARLHGFQNLHPAAGAQAELLGVMMTKVYFKQKNQKQRKKIIIPDSAHGTNPATAGMCRFETISIPSDSRGNMDINKFR